VSKASEHLRRSVVKIFTVTKKPNYYQPWDFGYQKSSGGSGCIIAEKRILTNAHVVSNQVYVQVLKAGDVKKYTAKVAFVDHGSDLALLTVDDPAFFDATVALEFGDLPERRDKVAAYGFPIGGNELSITEGVVSRIEVRSYTHSKRELLAIQVDAAINPGNSGGPVIKDGKLIGVAFQSYSRSKQVENSGYVVPVPLIERFLSDEKRAGIPSLGVYFQKLESDALREYLRMGPKDSGVLVTRVIQGSSASGVLAEDDVITRIAGQAVANDGSISFRGADRVHFSHVLARHHVGDRMEIEVLRNGVRETFTVELKAPVALVMRPRNDVRPTYFVFAGLVFTPLTYNYMHEYGEWKDIDHRFKHYYTDGLPSADRREIVLIGQVLAHDINVGYHKLHNAVVERVNGKLIGELRDVLAALKTPLGKFHVFHLDHHTARSTSDYSADAGTRIVIEAAKADAATREVLERYGIARDRSADLEGL
jgi:S1-C subfamily serine protease